MSITGTIRLEVQQQPERWTSWSSSAPTVVIGRSSECDLRLPSEVVSGRHAQLEVSGGRVILRDLDSRNGIYINQQLVNGWTMLDVGDEFQLGEAGPKFRIVGLENEAQADSVPQPVGSPQALSPYPEAELSPPRRARHPPFVKPMMGGEDPVALQGSVIKTVQENSPVRPQRPDTRLNTRKLLLSQARRTRLFFTALALGFAGLAIVLLWPKVDVRTKVYQKTLPSVALVEVEDGSGSGVLIDRQRKWLLTNHHVVFLDGQNRVSEQITVYFPSYDSSGELITDREQYQQERDRLGISARVVKLDETRDLALIELERLPPRARPLPLASHNPQRGEQVFTLGNPARSGALWVFTSGDVTQVYRTTQGSVPMWIVQTNNPVNVGDSGGPVVDINGRVIALVSSGLPLSRPTDLTQGVVSRCIHIDEVRSFLEDARAQR